MGRRGKEGKREEEKSIGRRMMGKKDEDRRKGRKIRRGEYSIRYIIV